MFQRTHFALGLAAAAGLALAPGCDTFQGGAQSTGETVGFAMQPSHSRILEGETVTLTTSSENTLGRTAEIVWHADGGDVRTSDSGRVAQITFPRAGTYNITADLMLDGRRAQTQSTTIEVRRLVVPGGEERRGVTESRDAQQGTTGYGDLNLQRNDDNDAQPQDRSD